MEILVPYSVYELRYQLLFWEVTNRKFLSIGEHLTPCYLWVPSKWKTFIIFFICGINCSFIKSIKHFIVKLFCSNNFLIYCSAISSFLNFPFLRHRFLESWGVSLTQLFRYFSGNWIYCKKRKCPQFLNVFLFRYCFCLFRNDSTMVCVFGILTSYLIVVILLHMFFLC